MERNTIETSVATISKVEPGIARVIYKVDARVTIAEARENVEAVTKMVDGVHSLVFIDVRTVSTIDRDSRQYFVGDEAGEVTSATALLVDSPMSRVIGNFFIGLNRSEWPVRMFSGESQAMVWLEGFLD